MTYSLDQQNKKIYSKANEKLLIFKFQHKNQFLEKVTHKCNLNIKFFLLNLK